MDKLNLDQLFNASKYANASALAAAGAMQGAAMAGAFPATGKSLIDVASLMLYGTHALPVRLKILLDRLLCRLDHEELVGLLAAFGWTFEDYSRGYMLKVSLHLCFTLRWSFVCVCKQEWGKRERKKVIVLLFA